MSSSVAAPIRRRVGRPPAGAGDTRERLLAQAERLFAERGFAGTSIRDVADALGLSGPALLHHFGSKERLYGEVLDRVAASMAPTLPAADAAPDARALAALVDAHLDWTLAHPHYSRLIMRELLENRARGERTRRWHLLPAMRAMIEAIGRGQAAGRLPAFDAEIFVYQFTGAIAHFAAASHTVAHMHGLAGGEPEAIERFRALQRQLLEAAMGGLAGAAGVPSVPLGALPVAVPAAPDPAPVPARAPDSAPARRRARP